MPRGPLLPGDPHRIAGYLLEARLGQGGQGAVFLGRDGAGRPVAVKLLHPELLEDTAARNRFVRELTAARRVARFCTAQIVDADTEGDRPYIVSEFVDGPSLQEAVARSGPRRGVELYRLAVSTATALTAIHQAGVVHCDFKPANVLLAPDGPRVIDFGIARALDASGTASQVIGTPAYMAPEQISRSEARPSVDVFAWGATIAFAINRASPFAADSGPATMYRVLESRPDLGMLAGTLRSLVEGCLEKDPADRPTSRDLLLALLAGRDVDTDIAGGLPGELIPDEGVARADTTVQLTPRGSAASTAPTETGTGASAGPAAGGTEDTPGRSRRRGRLIAAIATAVVLVTSVVITAVTLRPLAPAATAIPEAFAGQWSGRGRLPAEGTDVTPQVELIAGSRRADIGAGESSCAGGSLRFDSATSAKLTMDFRSSAGCPSGMMTFELTGDGRLEMYLGSEDDTTYYATFTR
jgi:hypothetical protein